MIVRTTCLLCERLLTPREDGLQDHPEVDDCEVIVTDRFGVAVDLDDHVKPVADDDGIIDLQTYPFVDEVLDEIFHAEGLERLGGISSGRGWSSISLFQKCPYAWHRRHIAQAKPFIPIEAPALAVGSLIHVFLAVLYMKRIVADYPLTPEQIYDRARQKANPDYVAEAWRVFSAYRLYYTYDNFQPLAVEHDLKDPRTGESCRLDTIVYFPEEAPMRLPGTYIMEHKSSGRFDKATLEGWSNDGEVLGQVMLWKRLGLDKRFGRLQGVVMNILGKQKEPEFHRTIVSPISWQIEQHREDLKRWEALIQLARSTGSFPRARHSCVGRFGMCEWWDHCATGDG